MALTDTFDNPQSRVEAILQNAMGAEHEVVPQSRVEELLDRLNGYLEDIEGKITDQDEEIIAAVNAWLEENFSGDYAVTDTTLTVSGMAADAKKTGDEFSELKEELTAKADVSELLKAFPTDTASGAVASFADGADVPVKSLIVNIDPVQEGSGDPSPTNVRPISGWSEVNVGKCGKNIADVEYGNTVPSITNGEMVSANGWSTGFISVDNSKNYMFSFVSTAPTYVFYYDENYNYLGNQRVLMNTDISTSPYFANARYVKLRNDAVAGNNPHIQLELGSTATSYEPYSGQSITIALGQTVYGGTLDVTNGVLTTYPYYASYNGETLTGAWISDRDKYVSGTTPTTGAQVVNIGGAGTDVQLTPHEVRSLLGSNNVWADTGDTEVTYRADPTLYISRLTEPDADMVADSDITSGSYFMVGNTLYKATANIASGATISPNVNCTRKSLSEALNELNA